MIIFFYPINHWYEKASRNTGQSSDHLFLPKNPFMHFAGLAPIFGASRRADMAKFKKSM